ncbi:histidine kinase dimerization/phosphoacceptor domain -containing protein [Reichenbachiella sp.]|uniref:histidine kinase dimerization/phosphoacceptor domain -containing protein n=1 Tax=Reichenbachiella sp. TaxID=2184521 RepID=UPI003BB21ACD
MIYAFLFYWMILSGMPVHIESIKLKSGTEDSIPTFETIDTELQFKQSYWAEVKMEIRTSGDYFIVGGKKYLRSMVFYNDRGEKLSTGNFVRVELDSGTQKVFIFYPFLDPKEDGGVALSVLPSARYLEQEAPSQMVKTGFLVIVFFLFVLSLAFYIVVRGTEIIYLEYALYLFSVYYFFAYQYGFFGYYFDWVNYIHPSLVWITSASITITYTLFIQSFLHLKEKDLLLWKVLNGGIGFVFFVVIVESISFAIGYDIQHSIFFTFFSLVVQMCFMLYSLSRIYKLKSTLSRIALLGASILVSTTLFGQLASTLKLVDQTNYFVMGALTMEIFIFNVGIGIRMALTNKQREKTQSLLIDQMRVNEQIQSDQKDQLEIAVAQRTEELAEKNEQNEMLLAEIHHRVKNNLQTISSFLSIQQRKLKDQSSKQAIKDSKNRVIAMGLIHEHLYKNASYAEINFASYLEELVKNLVNISSKPDEEVDLNFSIPPVQMEVENAILLGLIVNELISNCIKHAFPHVEHPKLSIDMSQREQHTVLRVWDNGSGKVDDLGKSDSFGWKIVNALVDRLKASIQFGHNEGFVVEIHLDSGYFKTNQDMV